MNCVTRKANGFARKTLVGANRVRIHLSRVKPIVLRVKPFVLMHHIRDILVYYLKRSLRFKYDLYT